MCVCGGGSFVNPGPRRGPGVPANIIVPRLFFAVRSFNSPRGILKRLAVCFETCSPAAGLGPICCTCCWSSGWARSLGMSPCKQILCDSYRPLECRHVLVPCNPAAGLWLTRCTCCWSSGRARTHTGQHAQDCQGVTCSQPDVPFWVVVPLQAVVHADQET